MHSIVSISLQQIFQWLIQYRYEILFPISIVEGPIVTIIAGFLVSINVFNAFIVYGIVVAGDVVGDTVLYALGRWGRPIIDKWGKFIGATSQRVVALEKQFKNHRKKTLTVGKYTHIFGAAIFVAAGAVRLPFWEYISFTFLLTLPKSLILILIGFYFGVAYVTLNKYLDYAAVITLIFLILALGAYFLIDRLINKKIKKDDDLL